MLAPAEGEAYYPACMTSSSLTLVVLAAGMGSRFGGLKQLEAVGPGGATLMDYSVFDALRAGFTSLVFVIREDMEDEFQAFAAQRYGTRVTVRTAVQRLGDALPAGAQVGERSKPWGTGHAVLAARERVTGPFVVVNADDFYGEAAFRSVAAFFAESAPAGPPQWAVVGYRLRDTLSASGGVSRALCRANHGWLHSVEELHDLKRDTAGTIHGLNRGVTVTVDNDALVSMNMWAFTPAVFPVLQDQFAVFHASRESSSGEFLIPAAVQAAIELRATRVRVLDAGSRWFGLTYRSDRPAVTVALGELVAAGRYPERLW